jgi:zinc/manganese transport system substrate-binding protein
MTMTSIQRILITLLITLTVALFAYPASAAEKIKVATTTTDLASIARYVGGDKVDVTSMATGREDPHHIAAKPTYMIAAREADLWIRIGMELEIGYEPLILDGSRNQKIRVGSEGHLDTSPGVLRLEVPTQKVDRSMGDIHPQGNPHYMLDPLNGRIVAKTIAQRLARLAPEHTAYFTERLKAFRKELDEHMFGEELVNKIGGGKLWEHQLKGRLETALGKEKDALGGWYGKMSPYSGKKMITVHRNWSYFVHRFGLNATMQLEPKPGIPPSPGRLTEVIQHVKDQQIEVLVMANYFSRQACDLVSEQTGITVVELPMFPGAMPKATDYFTLFDTVVEKVVRAYEKKGG